MSCILNMIKTGFIESACRLQYDHGSQVLEHICGEQERIEEAEAYFVQLPSPNGIDEDEGENPVVALDRFCQALEQTGSRTFFEKHGLHVYFDNLDSLFHLMDADRDG